MLDVDIEVLSEVWRDLRFTGSVQCKSGARALPDIGKFRRRLLTWFSDQKRDLPWRRTKDPYKIWLSEIILQQTRVAQGLSYYHKFIEHYPTVSDLASASEHEVLKLWQGLGYYSRARNMLAAAISIKENSKSKFPK